MAKLLSVTVLLCSLAARTSSEDVAPREHRERNVPSDLESALSHMRMVVKHGIKVKGTYSYSDGHYRKTIYYIADNKGYRVTGEDIIPLEDNKPSLVNPEEIHAEQRQNPSSSPSRPPPT